MTAMESLINKYTTNCFNNCKENMESCNTCEVQLECTGCELCGTSKQEPCMHCEILCEFEESCKIRERWIQSFIDKKDCSKCKTLECENSKPCLFIDYYNTSFDSKEDSVDLTNQPRTTIVSNTPTYISQYSQQQMWTSEVDCIDECPHKSELETQLSVEVAKMLLHLQKKFPNHEFMVYGTSVLDESGMYTVERIYIPEQDARSATVDNIIYDESKYETPINTVIHKHPGKSPGNFSKTDHDYGNANHDFSILIGSEGLDKIVGTARVHTKCGELMRVPLKVTVQQEEVTNSFFLESIKNIKTSTYVSKPTTNEWWKDEDWKKGYSRFNGFY